ncbi:YkgJ family cysteine cluster protein [Clostridium sp. YIM B02505]|uniref:YkgJ family cysteine cluster protein n=1 Tax=Clostridium yunnanense TaxID=2800325 RepID=A0ABS1ERF4_9CLOT|nr:YkgJ family cysteine cluster protein [Clostridium yunnanense]MBK1811922.1 YkgJ family cysteine cluster protein [Clostridium yunnanense]
MNLLFDSEGKVNYDKINKETTVKDVLEAIDIFLNNNPIPCDTCKESCCKKAWSVEMDNVCVNRISNWDERCASDYVKKKLVKKRNYYREFDQYVLDKEKNCHFITEENYCTIYEQRPIICRLYICIDKSYRYNVVRELIGSTYLKALIFEEEMRTSKLSDELIKQYKRNPAVFAKGYDISLNDIFNYSEEEGWLYEDERDELY